MDGVAELTKISDIYQHIPVLGLPVWGFINPNYHVLLMHPEALDIFRYQDTFSNIRLIGGLINGMISQSKTVLATLAPMATYLMSLQFYGVQPMRFKGLTQYKDVTIDSYQDTLHYVLTPNEYVVFGLPVHAVADGEVVEVCNEYEDKLHQKRNVDLYSFNVNEYMGNVVKIRHNNFIYSLYGFLRKNHIKVRVGDKVKKGQIIGQVGMSGQTDIPLLHFQLSLLPDVKIPWVGDMNIPINGIKWDTHLAFNLMMGNNRKLESITGLYPKDIDYHPEGKMIGDVSLIKKCPVIRAE